MAETLYINGNTFRAGAGKFNTARRYIRANTVGALFPIVQSQTLSLTTAGFSTGARYSVNGLIEETTKRDGGLAPDDNVNSGTYNATFELVKF